MEANLSFRTVLFSLSVFFVLKSGSYKTSPNECALSSNPSLLWLANVGIKVLQLIYKENNNTWARREVEFLFEFSTPYLTRSLRALVRYRIQREEKFHFSTKNLSLSKRAV